MKKVIATLPVCNTISLNIYEVNELGEYVVVGYNDENPTYCELKYDGDRPFFDLHGDIFYLDEFIFNICCILNR